MAVYDFGPDGTQFSPPATLTIQDDVSSLTPEQHATLGLYVYSPPDSAYVPLANSSCQVNEGPPETFIATCTADVDHFSLHAMVADSGVANCSLSFCADVDMDGIRDDGCVWWSCEDHACVGLDIAFADMGGAFGACDPDGTADGNDRFHALNCFSNADTTGNPGYPCEDSPPQSYNVDAGGPFGDCDPDGVCDGNDAFHALNAFQGSTTCSCPSGPAPTPPEPPVAVAATSIRLQADRQTVRPGETFEVHAFLVQAVPDLRGYQLHLGVRGAAAGTLDLVDIAVDDRKDAAFAGLADWRAFNVETGQMVTGLDTAGVHSPIDAYLATFVLTASSDAAGPITIDLLHDDQDRSQRTFLFPTPAGGKIAVESVTPAVVMVVEPIRARLHR